MNILKTLKHLYPQDYQKVYDKIELLINKDKKVKETSWVSQEDVMLITYGDSIKKENERPLQTLNRFLDEHTNDEIKNVHILPMFPYTSDDGFSVVDYEEINPELGTWEDIKALAKDRGLMFDAVINHISKSSEWFKGYLKGDEKYANYFIECDPTLDYSDVVRPRALPLFYPYETNKGIKHIWATFSEDQVDLNYENSDVFIKMLEILINYAQRGARFIRFDAVAFLWKKLGTTSIHLPETHMIVKLMRYVLDQCVPGTFIVSETNVPHDENITYFGNGLDEAHMVYQFPLPPLTLFSFVTGDATKLNLWAKSLNETKLTNKTTYFNFLASHDGIGMRPTEGILSADEVQLLADHVSRNGGKINYKINKDGSLTPYELNVNYQDAISNPDDSQKVRINKFMASQTILLSIIGVPGIYIHSLLGSRNDYVGLAESNINRRINREKLNYDLLINEITDEKTTRHIVFNEYLKLINLRIKYQAFSPTSSQTVLDLSPHVFSIIRHHEKTNEKILVIVNVSNKQLNLDTTYEGIDIIEQEIISNEIIMNPYQYRWILMK